MALLNQFARFYSAEILRRSGANSRLGDLYDWAGPFNQRLEPVEDNVINHVEPDPATRQLMREQASAAPQFSANFADTLDLTNTLQAGVKLGLPNVPLAVAADLQTKRVVNFEFRGVVLRTMPDELGIQLRELLEQFKATAPDKYRQYLRPYDLAVTLYYAREVVLRLDHTQAVSAEAQTMVESLKGSVVVNAEGHQELRFNQLDCPFAVTLKAAQKY